MNFRLFLSGNQASLVVEATAFCDSTKSLEIFPCEMSMPNPNVCGNLLQQQETNPIYVNQRDLSRFMAFSTAKGKHKSWCIRILYPSLQYIYGFSAFTYSQITSKLCIMTILPSDAAFSTSSFLLINSTQNKTSATAQFTRSASEIYQFSFIKFFCFSFPILSFTFYQYLVSYILFSLPA